MAIEKVVGKAITKVGFKTDLASYRRAVKHIDDIKNKMKGLKKTMGGSPLSLEVRNATQSVRQARNVIRKVNQEKMKANETLLADMLRKEEAVAKKRGASIDAARRKQAVGSLTAGKPTSAKGTLLADMLVAEEKRAKVYERLFDQAEVNLARKRRRLDADRVRNQERLAKEKSRRTTRTETRSLFFEDIAAGTKLKPEKVAHFRREMNLLNGEYQRGNMATQIYTEKTRQVINSMKRASAQTRTLHQEMNALRSAFVAATASATVFSAGAGIVDVGKQFQALEVGTRTVFGKEGAAENLKFLTDESERLGFRLLDTTKDFTKFSVAAGATALETDQVRDIFSGTMEASRVFGLSGEQNALVLKALTQILSKGTVQAKFWSDHGNMISKTPLIAGKSI